MCFSAGASFTASAVLGAVGVATVAKTKNRRELPLSYIPLIFAFQQLIEGFLWVALNNGLSGLILPLTDAYLFFALLWWPIYAPFAVYLLEEVPWRKKTILFLGFLGIVAGSIQYSIFLQHPSSAYILHYSIFYDVPMATSFILSAAYSMATVGAGLISSKRAVNIFAFLVGIFGIIAWYEYQLNSTSVWCFFGAILSFVLLFSPRSDKDKKGLAGTSIKKAI